jgi:general secretion pathway protein H
MILRNRKKDVSTAFFEKKAAKKLLRLRALATTLPKPAVSKSFLVLFFKKEPLATAGFTLLEMLVVILVMSLILGLLAAYGPPKSRWAETRAAARAVAGAMDAARGQAITSGAAATLRLPALPDWLAERVTAPDGRIVFEPDGSASGGTVVLDDGGRRLAVTADWLTGQVRVDGP